MEDSQHQLEERLTKKMEDSERRTQEKLIRIYDISARSFNMNASRSNDPLRPVANAHQEMPGQNLWFPETLGELESCNAQQAQGLMHFYGLIVHEQEGHPIHHQRIVSIKVALGLHT